MKSNAKELNISEVSAFSSLLDARAIAAGSRGSSQSSSRWPMSEMRENPNVWRLTVFVELTTCIHRESGIFSGRTICNREEQFLKALLPMKVLALLGRRTFRRFLQPENDPSLMWTMLSCKLISFKADASSKLSHPIRTILDGR